MDDQSIFPSAEYIKRIHRTLRVPSPETHTRIRSSSDRSDTTTHKAQSAALMNAHFYQPSHRSSLTVDAFFISLIIYEIEQDIKKF